MSKTYNVKFLDERHEPAEEAIECDTVHVDARGTKLLNGRGAAAELVAFFPTDRIINITQVGG